MSERKNSPLDILVIVIGTLLFSVAFGFAIYFVFVYIILPLAIEFIPALDTYLTRLGREHDAEEIYRTIYQTCALIGVIPAVCVANAAVRFRMNIFIKETGGTIPPREGFVYHLKNHIWYDAVATVLTVVAGFVIYMFDRGIGVSPFHILYCRLGIAPSLLISAVMIALTQLIAVVIAQNSWRAEHFFGD